MFGIYTLRLKTQFSNQIRNREHVKGPTLRNKTPPRTPPWPKSDSDWKSFPDENSLLTNNPLDIYDLNRKHKSFLTFPTKKKHFSIKYHPRIFKTSSKMLQVFILFTKNTKNNLQIFKLTEIPPDREPLDRNPYWPRTLPDWRLVTKNTPFGPTFTPKTRRSIPMNS